ncbi:hypothetical protein MSAN_01798900 [Mycena sanguinolenta]|uniref:DUF6534 domain-containing protein n=1 Tax=Mycena sanguinolenta TaxID=230812 RepID=A0A8H7CQM0_9AGAR|nr:hypothetical protein MSAN_01798900 [Mycena sanguinolenta]
MTTEIHVTTETGPMILSIMWSYMLYGVLMVQIYMYTETFPTDRRGFKILVWVVLFFETCSTALMTVAAWNMFGSGWGDPVVLSQLSWPWGLLPLLSGVRELTYLRELDLPWMLAIVVSSQVQGFYAWRIWHLTEQFWWPVPIVLTILVQYVALLWFGITWNLARWRVSAFGFGNSDGIGIWLAATALSDVLITIALTSHFCRCKRRNQFAGTTGMLNRLIRLSIETGALTGIPAIIGSILCFGTFSYNFTVFLLLDKLYSNVMMASLNGRKLSRGSNVSAETMFWAELVANRPEVPAARVNSVALSGVAHAVADGYADTAIKHVV